MSLWFASSSRGFGQTQPAELDQVAPIRVGMIGLDTSHTVAFAKILREAKPEDGAVGRLKLVAAYPGGSQDIPSSANRVEGFTREIRESGVAILDSIDELVGQVDAVLLTSVDGRKHLEQAIPVFRAGKPCFIDKPFAADLADAIAIHRASEQFHARWFTSSSLRFTPTIWRYRENTSRKIVGAQAWSPCSLDPHHNDLAWYGIHGIEALYTAMGTGCRSVARSASDGSDVAIGVWGDGRHGVFRGIRNGHSGYGMTVFGADFIESDAKYDGYEPLVVRFAEFFAGANHPVSNEESLEIMAFIEAAQVSRQRGGAPVTLEEVLAAAQPEAEKRLERLLNPSEFR
jgi:predicted dehydrogenase